MISLLLLNHIYPVIISYRDGFKKKKKKATNSCIRFRSLVTVRESVANANSATVSLQVFSHDKKWRRYLGLSSIYPTGLSLFQFDLLRTERARERERETVDGRRSEICNRRSRFQLLVLLLLDHPLRYSPPSKISSCTDLNKYVGTEICRISASKTDFLNKTSCA